MLAVALPFLISANTLAVVLLMVFITSSVLFMIPAMAMRGGAQFAWFAGASFALTVEIVVFVTLVVLTSRGAIF